MPGCNMSVFILVSKSRGINGNHKFRLQDAFLMEFWVKKEIDLQVFMPRPVLIGRGNEILIDEFIERLSLRPTNNERLGTGSYD